MQSKLRLIPLSAVALVLASCGGGGSPAFVGPVYTVTNGHVTGAKVICKVNPNSDGEASPNFAAVALTDANGQTRFAQACNAETVASGGHNPDGLPLKGLLRAPVNGTVLTPLTTLLVGPNALTEAQVIQALDLPATTKLLSTDPDSGSELLLHAKSVAVQQIMLQVTQTLAKLGGVDVSAAAPAADVAKLQSAYDVIKDALAQTISANPHTPLISVTGTTAVMNATVVNTFIQNAALAASKTDSNIQTGVNKVGVTNLAAAMQPALTAQANLITSATSSATALSTVTTNLQSNTGIPDAVATAVLGTATTQPTLTTSTTKADVTAFANTVVLAAVNTTTTTTSSTSTSSTSSSSTTTSTTTTTLPVNYLYLTGDSIGYNDGTTGATTVTYTLANFHSAAGILVKWPMADAAALEFKLAASGTFVAPTGPVTVALAMTDTAVNGKGQIKAYIDNVNVASGSNGITVSVPATAHAWVYAMAPDGSEVKSSFADSVTGVNNALAYGSTSSITLGSVVKNATKRLGALTDLSGKYRVTLVINGLSLALADGSPMTSYTVDVPAANSAIKSVSGVGIEGYMTVVNPNPTTTTSTTTSTTTTSSTTTTTVSPTNYVYLANDSIGFDNGAGATSYTVAQFQASPGIAVKWPMASTASLSFTLTNAGTFNLGSGQTTSAALEIADVDPTGLAWLKAYIDGVKLTQSGANVVVSVPATALARIYARGTDGTEILSGFADAVAGVNNTLTTGVSSSIVVGNVVSNAMARLGSGSALVNKTYRVTLVLRNAPVRLASGANLVTGTVTVPGLIGATAAPVSVTGPSLTGFINLIP